MTPVRLDCAAALALAAAATVGFHELAATAAPRPLILILVLLSVLPAAVRRLWPRSVLAVVTIAAALVVALSHGDPPPQLAVAYVIYLIPGRFPRSVALALLGGTLAVLAASAAALPGREALTALAENLPLAAGSWLIGYAVAQQRAYAKAVRSQEEREDRIRIARELHDVVAHGLSLIAVQAGVAGWVAESQPAEAARALASIEEISRGALREMRALLGVLRVEDDAAADLEPAHGLADLPALADRVTAAGIKVTLDVRGSQRELLPGLDLAAYRVAQEALTNVIKHSGAASCRVTVRYEAESVELEIADDGRGHGAARAPAGHGIKGMRERVALYDGTFQAGPGPEGGFTVTARFPA